MKRNVLLIEPNYKNKYPPIGLMKLSTYHKQLGDNVKFFKGDLKSFVITEIVSDSLSKLKQIDNKTNWFLFYDDIFEYIKTGKHNILNSIIEKQTKYKATIETWLIHFKDYYRKEKYKLSPKWDRICISSLFTFYYKITINTINFAKYLINNIDEIHVGGVTASVLPAEIQKDTGIKPYKGLLNKPRILDDNDIIIDQLPLDYSILDEIDYKYSANNAFYGYSTRGCIRKCSFCAVPIIEPKFKSYISISKQINEAKAIFGDKQNLLLLDNNVLASKHFSQIIDEIKECGFEKGSTFIEPNYLDIYKTNLKNKINDAAYIKATFELYISLLKKLKGEEKQQVYDIFDSFNLLNLKTTTKSALLKAYPLVKRYYDKCQNKTPRQRKVDFNQGVDARLLNENNVKLLSEIAISPLRIAFDSMAYKEVYVKAIHLCTKYGIKSLSNYLLYNENDHPLELYQRLKINVELCDQLSVNIYSFPMKYHPIFGEYNLNRNFIGKYWNRKFIRAIQTILNATKGKIGRGKSFFYKAFGEDEEEYKKLLYMPETYILYRFFFEDIGYTQKWSEEFNALKQNDFVELNAIIHSNEFKKEKISQLSNKKVRDILNHYLITREEVIDSASYLGKLKVQYDKLGTTKQYAVQ